jgi:hypothetical protein
MGLFLFFRQTELLANSGFGSCLLNSCAFAPLFSDPLGSIFITISALLHAGVAGH